MNIIDKLKNRKCKLVFTNGCFDILHEGHIQTLNFAKSKGDILVVGLNSDDSIKRLKGENRPIVPEKSRYAVLSNLRMVDVIVFGEDTPINLIKELKPDVLIKGQDYNVYNVIGKEYVKEIILAPLIEGISTTKIVENIKKP